MKTGRRILVVDNEPVWQIFARKALERAGFLVQVEESLQHIAATSDALRADLVFVDDLALRSEQDRLAFGQLAQYQTAIVLSVSPTVRGTVGLYKLAKRIVNLEDKPFAEDALVTMVNSKLVE